MVEVGWGGVASPPNRVVPPSGWQRPSEQGKQEAAARLSRSKATGANRLWS